MLDLGTTLPPFRLRDLDGKVITSNDFGNARGVLVAFICPHCPFVRHIRAEFRCDTRRKWWTTEKTTKITYR
ncbi:MAG: hypothetical protein HC784_13810 [Hydrococcus sp. CSU_1_8]|nr:hypothetical protein [Hydrococcus sp. CSU_1_8]